jgi:LEA14-like dessication related protein
MFHTGRYRNDPRHNPALGLAPQADGGCPPTTIRLSRRAALLGALPLAACASLGGREPLTVDVVGVEPLAGQGMEGRFLVKLRLQNPGETPVDFDGVSVSLDVRGSRLASGVGDVRGTVPRFGETVIAVPVTVPVSAMIRQALGFASGDRTRLDYELRGRLAGPGFGGVSFKSSGELTLPAGGAS